MVRARNIIIVFFLTFVLTFPAIVNDSYQLFPPGNRIVYDLLTDNVACPTDPDGDNDSDKDAVCDMWETGQELEIWDPVNDPNKDHVYVFNCGAELCNQDKRDIFLEIDWMEGHQLDPDAKQLVIDAFDRNGIRLHIQEDSNWAIAHKPNFIFPGYEIPGFPQYAGFDQLKGNHFGDSDSEIENNPDWYPDLRRLKHQVFHYGLIVHDRQWYPGQSGIGELGGNDFMISLGSYTGGVGSTDQQAGTLMHELGHNLGLHHGGGITDSTPQSKPNHFSVMSYSRQFATYDVDRIIDFSNKTFGNSQSTNSLSESNIDEDPVGIDTYEGHESEKIIYSCGGVPSTLVEYPDGTSVNWDCLPGDAANDNVNDFPESPSYSSSETLIGHNDWASIDFDFTDSSDFADGVHHVASGVTPLDFTADAQRDFGENLPPDQGVTYVSDGEEITYKDVVLQRLGLITSLYRDVYSLDNSKFNFDISSIPSETKGLSSILPQFTEYETLSKQIESTFSKGNTPLPTKLGPKDSFLWGIESIGESIINDDLKMAKLKIELLDRISKEALPQSYANFEETFGDLGIMLDIALASKITSIHNVGHQKSMNPLVDPSEFIDLTNKAKTWVDTTSYDRDFVEVIKPLIILPPLKQTKAGVAPLDVECKEFLELILKPNGVPLCVTTDTKMKLEIRWGY